MSHLVFYDGECGLCDHVVRWLLPRDDKKQFLFAPLQGKTAQEVLSHLPEEIKKADSVILVENYRQDDESVSIYGKAAFRIAWLLGGKWKLMGWLNFLPAVLYDWGYRLVARNRKKIFGETCLVPDSSYQDRFLE